MQKIKDVLRLHLVGGIESRRQIARAVDDAHANYTNRGMPGVVVPISSPISSKRLVIHG